MMTKKFAFTENTLLILLVLIGALHRLALFVLYYDDLNSLIAANPEWLTWQFLTIPALSDQLWKSLVYLQQTPPLPNLILGLALQWFNWPFQIAYVLIGLQTLFSLLTAALLFRILCLWWPSYKWIHVGLSILFILNTDLLVMEYNSFGQTFYENLAMTLITATIYVFIRLKQTNRTFYVVLLGGLIALLALSRSSYSYVFIVVLPFLLLGSQKRFSHVVIFLAMVILLHGGWVLKNYLVYDYVEISTSSWKGGNFAAGLSKAGLGEALQKSILEEPQYYSDWFVNLTKNHGIVYWWNAQVLSSYVSPETLKQDQQINELLEGHNRPENSIAQRLLFDQQMLAYKRFMVKYPELIWDKFLKSYGMFWQPIKNYGILFVDLFCVEGNVGDLDVFDIAKTLLRTPPEQQLVMTHVQQSPGKYVRVVKSANFYTIDTFSHVIQFVNLIIIHLVAPLVLGFILIRYLLGRPMGVWESTYIFGFALYWYAAVVFNLPEFMENMRFRLSVEPVIWLLSATTMVYLVHKLTEMFAKQEVILSMLSRFSKILVASTRGILQPLTQHPVWQNCSCRFALKLFAVAWLIFGARLWLIKIAGTSLPYFDEWEVGFYTLLPALYGHLNLSDLLVPYGEHPILLIRLLTLGLTVLNDGQWEPLLQMVVNAFLYTVTAVIFAVILRNWLDKSLENWILLSITLLGIIPVGWINILWGFQSSWYLLSLLTLLTLWGLLLHENLTWQWAVGLVCGILGCFNLASGFFVLIVVVILQFYLIIINRDHIRNHLFTLGIIGLLVLISVIQLMNASKHSELYSKDIFTFLTSFGKFLAWPWVDYPLLSLLMYFPFFALLTRIVWLRRPLVGGELLIIALGGWVILQVIAMAFARGAGEGVHPIARYWEIMTIGVIVNFFAFHFLAKPWYGLPESLKSRVNLAVHSWGVLLLCGIYVLMVQAVPDIKVKIANSKEQLANVRNYLSTGELVALKVYPMCPYPHPQLLAHFLKRPNFQKLLPPSLMVPSQVPPSQSESAETVSTFVPKGVYPTAKTRGEKMLGSYNAQQNEAVGHFKSITLSPPRQTFMAIPVSGYLGEKDLSLRLEVEGQSEPIWLTPHKVAREGLVSIYLPTPPRPFKIVAEDNNPKLWFAFAMPRGVGKLSAYTQMLLQEWQMIITIGFLLLALVVSPKIFDNLTQATRKGT